MTERERITVGQRRAPNDRTTGETVSLPVVEVLTGRGFVTGKSGSGKSNTASVIVEELLESGYPVLIVDTDGEYYGLKEEYELLHAGADEGCDIRIGPEHAEKVATLALERNVPIILDVSGYLDGETADELLRETARHLFAKERKLKKPFLLVVEEIHEYVPEGGGLGETGRMLIKIGKRGRKHGLGIVGISQRPADVKKDFITQANWLVWHRLTWGNDTKVVGRIVGGEYGETIPDLADGEAFVQTDWTDGGVRRVQFERKRTFDAGATPGLDEFERPELKSVSDTLVDDLQTITDEQRREEDRIAELEDELDAKDDRIERLEADLESARDVSAAARRMATALSGGDVTTAPDRDAEETTADELDRLRTENTALEAELERLRARVSASEGRPDGDAPEPVVDPPSDGVVIEPTDRTRRPAGATSAESVEAEIDAAGRRSLCDERQAWAIVEVVAADGGATVHEIEDEVTVPVQRIWTLLMELRRCSCITRDSDGTYSLHRTARDVVEDTPDEPISSSSE